MTASARHLVPTLQAMVKEDRAALADVLLATLDDEQAETEAAWDAELSRRKDEILSGKAKGTPAAEVFARLDAKFP